MKKTAGIITAGGLVVAFLMNAFHLADQVYSLLGECVYRFDTDGADLPATFPGTNSGNINVYYSYPRGCDAPRVVRVDYFTDNNTREQIKSDAPASDHPLVNDTGTGVLERSTWLRHHYLINYAFLPNKTGRPRLVFLYFNDDPKHEHIEFRQAAK